MRLIDADALKIAIDDGWMPDMIVSEIWGVIDESPTIGGWINVKDRLPEKEGQYLCWFGKNTVCKGAAIVTYLEEWKAFGSLESLETYPNVTHWLPIQEPPET